jgi:hypothetical protein
MGGELGAKHRWNHDDVVFTLRKEGEDREDFDQPLNLKILLSWCRPQCNDQSGIG